MKFHLSLMVLFNLSAVLISNQTLLASATDEKEENRKQSKVLRPLEFQTTITLRTLDPYKNERRFPEKHTSFTGKLFSSRVFSFGELPSPREEDEDRAPEFHDHSKVISSGPVILPKRDANQEVDLLIKSVESLSLVERAFKQDEKVQSLWNRFPMGQIGELREAISSRTPKCIGSMTMYVANGLAKFLVIDAIPFPTTHMKSLVSSKDFFAHFFDLKGGEEVFTSPLSMVGNERSYAFSKDPTDKKEISFKLILKRLHLEEEEFLKFSSFHPLEIKLQTFDVVSDPKKCGVFCLTSVHMSTFKDRLEAFREKDLESISHSDFSIAHVEAHEGFLSVVYAYQALEFDLDDTSLNIYDPETKAFRYLHIKLHPQIVD
jgi:hypothetical protein